MVLTSDHVTFTRLVSLEAEIKKCPVYQNSDEGDFNHPIDVDNSNNLRCEEDDVGRNFSDYRRTRCLYFMFGAQLPAQWFRRS